MFDHPLRRRLITVPVVVLGFALVTVGLPFLLVVGLLFDLGRTLRRRRRAMATRLVVFMWVYLLGETWALAALVVSSLLPGDGMSRLSRLQAAWARWNLDAAGSIFMMNFEAENVDVALPGPILVFSRHASIVDSLLPAVYISGDLGLRLRYVLKRELLVDPALDIAGNRLPNHFVDRGRGGVREVAAIRELASDLGPDEGVVIYPEGTRFSTQRLAKARVPSGHRTNTVAAIAATYENVLPPRTAGPLAVLDANQADVVVLAHRGLESFARVKDVWEGAAVGTNVEVRCWRVSRSAIPDDDEGRVEWLYRTWADVDAWVGHRGARS